MQYKDCSHRDRAWILFGSFLVVCGIVLLFSLHTSWWAIFYYWIRNLSRLAVPIALLGVGAYVIWGARRGRFQDFGTAASVRAGQLRRSKTDVRIAGVCGGIAQYFRIDAALIRITAVLLAIASPLFTLIAYGALTIILKQEH